MDVGIRGRLEDVGVAGRGHQPDAWQTTPKWLLREPKKGNDNSN